MGLACLIFSFCLGLVPLFISAKARAEESDEERFARERLERLSEAIKRWGPEEKIIGEKILDKMKRGESVEQEEKALMEREGVKAIKLPWRPYIVELGLPDPHRRGEWNWPLFKCNVCVGSSVVPLNSMVISFSVPSEVRAEKAFLMWWKDFSKRDFVKRGGQYVPNADRVKVWSEGDLSWSGNLNPKEGQCIVAIMRSSTEIPRWSHPVTVHVEFVTQSSAGSKDPEVKKIFGDTIEWKDQYDASTSIEGLKETKAVLVKKYGQWEKCE